MQDETALKSPRIEAKKVKEEDPKRHRRKGVPLKSLPAPRSNRNADEDAKRATDATDAAGDAKSSAPSAVS